MSERPGGLHGDEPSPEDRFAGRATWSGPPAEPQQPVNVLLGDANLELPVNCIKGVRAVLQALADTAPDNPEPITIGAASDTFDRFKQGERPLLLGHAPSRALAAAAAEAGVKASGGNLVIGYNMTEDDIAKARSEHTATPAEPAAPAQPTATRLITPSGVPGDDFKPSLAASKVALNLLGMHEGNATLALFWARVLKSNTGDALYDEVAGLIGASFPIKWEAGE